MAIDFNDFSSQIQGTTPFMTRVRNMTGRAARGAAVAAALLAVAPAIPAAAQEVATSQAPPAQPRGMSESVAAVVNDQIISTYDLAQRMRLLIVTSGVQPTAQTLPQFQREALISLVDERLQIQELRRLEKDQKITLIASDQEVDEELSEMARGNNMTGEQFLGVLRSQGIAPDTMREQLRAQVSWQRWIRGRYGSRLRIGEDQIKAAQDRLAATSTKPQYQISEVLIDANRVGGMDSAIQGGNQLVAQLQQGAPFPAVARQFSASPTAASGGDAGWVSQGEMAPEVQAALDQMRPGQLSRPIPVKDGVYIIYLRDKRAGAGAMVVSLKQAAVALGAGATAAQVEAARVKLEQVRSAATGCDNLEAAAGKVDGVVAGDLGEAEIADLAPDFRQAAQSLQPGQISQPIRTTAGLHLVAVCGKRAGGAEGLTHDEIENRLFGQQLSMISRRYMRDLRNSATIETR
jgi:peptidyl-prolyl cis-trans isomerase SurA